MNIKINQILAGNIFFIFLFFNLLSAQEYPSIHQISMEQHQWEPPNPSLIGPANQKIVPLAQRPATLNATIFGYLPYWSSSDYLQYDRLTHIAAFGVSVNSHGNVTNSHGWPWSNLINTAHSHGVKVILTATLFSGNDVHTLITTSGYKNNFFNNMKSLILQGNADGLNVDFESLNSADRGSLINNFMSELTAFLHSEIPGSEVSFAGPAINWGGWNFSGLADACDYIFIMGYSFAGSWSSSSGPEAPLSGGSYNITTSVTGDYASVTNTHPEKLILGVPYYGYHWRTANNQPRSTVLQSIGSVFYSSAQTGAQTYGRQWDAISQTPWYRYQDGSNWHQVWYDDTESLGLKYDLALANSLGGIGMWALGYDGNRAELWDLIDQKFGSGQLPPPGRPLALRVLVKDENSLHVQFQASANATGYYVYLSGDGLIFTDSLFISSSDATIDGLETDSLYFVRIRSANQNGLSQPTEVLAGVPSVETKQALIVNGFDRVSGTNNTFNYIRQHGKAIYQRGYAFASASNEAISLGLLSLSDYKTVDWILGDESSANDTFNAIEQNSVKAFLNKGGNLFVSGAEIGWDLVHKGSTADKNFYNNYLKANYIADAPNDQSATYYSVTNLTGSIFDGNGDFNFDDGTHGTFDVDWPDAIEAINGAQNCMKYSNTNAFAGISYFGLFPGGTAAGKLVHFAFPFETVYPEAKRFEIMNSIFSFFETTTTVAKNHTSMPRNFQLFQNYPNPFNQTTIIGFSIPQPGKVSLEIFNMNGIKVAGFKNISYSAGNHNWGWHGRNFQQKTVGSGAYIYRIVYKPSNGGYLQTMNRKMLLIK